MEGDEGHMNKLRASRHEQETDEIISDLEQSVQALDVGNGDDAAATTETDEREVVAEFSTLPYKIVLMEDVYGPGHRGVVATQSIPAGTLVHAERPRAYIKEEPTDAVYTSMYYPKDARGIPEALVEKKIRRAAWVALTGSLAAEQEQLCEALVDSELGLHGTVDINRFPPPGDVHELVRDHCLEGDKEERWPLDRFARLYGVVQSNAKEGMVPLSVLPYGVGLFPGSAYFNHSCAPNAQGIMTPHDFKVHTTLDVRPGDEITISYGEIPVDLLTENLVRCLRYERTFPGDCVCVVCRDLPRNEDDVDEEGRATSTVAADLEFMWSEKTWKCLSESEEIRYLVTSMIKGSLSIEGVAAAIALKEQHPLLFVRDDPAYCADLAYYLGYTYCRTIIHCDDPKVPPDLYVFWAKVYLEAIGTSTVSMPRGLQEALEANVFAAFNAYRKCLHYAKTEIRIDEERPWVLENPAEDTEEYLKHFIMWWVALRQFHVNIYHTPAYMALFCGAFPGCQELAQLHAASVKEAEYMLATARREDQNPGPIDNDEDEKDKEDESGKDEEENIDLCASRMEPL